MKINADKTKYMIINFCHSTQFTTRLHVEKTLIDQVREVKLLGVLLTENLTWEANTDMIVKKAYKRMCILRKLYEFRVSIEDLKQIYMLYIRSIVEQSRVVWSSSLTLNDERKIERVQKIALRIILKEGYKDYNHALQIVGLQTLQERRVKLCLNFAKRCVNNEETSYMFPLKKEHGRTRYEEPYAIPFAYTERLKYSAIPYMARLLNKEDQS